VEKLKGEKEEAERKISAAYTYFYWRLENRLSFLSYFFSFYVEKLKGETEDA